MRIKLAGKASYMLHSLSTKFFIWIIILLIIPACFAFVYSYRQFGNIIREEVSQKSIDNVSKIKGDVNGIFDSMVGISNFIVSNTNIQKAFEDDSLPYLDRYKIVDDEIANMFYSNTFLNDIYITIFDSKKQVYSNWARSFDDYSFLLEEDWIKKAAGLHGNLVWKLFGPSYIKQDKNVHSKYFSLARALGISSGNVKYNGVLILSLKEADFQSILLKSDYISNKDDVVMISSNTGEVISVLGEQSFGTRAGVNEVLQEVNKLEKGYRIKDIGGRKYLGSFYTIDEIPWTFDENEWNVFVFTLYDNVIRGLNEFSRRMVFLFAVFVAVLLVITFFLAGGIVKPIKKLDRQMQKFNLDSEMGEPDVNRRDEIGHLNRAFYKMAESIKSLFNQVVEEYEEREKYRFESIRAQVNPHFLYNTLNTIRWMALIRKADNIVETIDALGNLLKFSTSRGSEMILLHEELENIKSYVLIQNYRYGNMYKIEYDIPEELLDIQVIKFILQPIVENAILHAFKHKEGTGLIKITASADLENCIVIVKDNGGGIEENKIRSILNIESGAKQNESKMSGLGIRNVDDRIKAAYGPRYGITIYSRQGEGTTVKIVFPVIRRSE